MWLLFWPLDIETHFSLLSCFVFVFFLRKKVVAILSLTTYYKIFGRLEQWFAMWTRTYSKSDLCAPSPEFLTMYLRWDPRICISNNSRVMLMWLVGIGHFEKKEPTCIQLQLEPCVSLSAGTQCHPPSLSPQRLLFCSKRNRPHVRMQVGPAPTSLMHFVLLTATRVMAKQRNLILSLYCLKFPVASSRNLSSSVWPFRLWPQPAFFVLSPTLSKVPSILPY